jgi:two-component system LytT family sensor kinase
VRSGVRMALIKIGSKWRVLLVIAFPAAVLCALILMQRPTPAAVSNGIADLTGVDFSRGALVALNGQWEFYWNRLLSPEDFFSSSPMRPDTFMKVPGVWSANMGTHYSQQGIATYRLTLDYSSSLADPALRVQNVANAYKLYINGQLTAEVGSDLTSKENIKNDDEILIIPLPKDTRHIDLVFQVANLTFATGGLRVAPVFGSAQTLEQQRLTVLLLQMFFIGGVFIFGLYYLFLFILQRKNKTALFFAVFCLITAVRSLVWGETPLTVLFPHASLGLRMYINYFTGYNFVAFVILFVRSIYPEEFRKIMTGLVLLPSLIFSALLVFINPGRMTFLTNYAYLFLILQMVYLLYVQIKAVLHRRDDAILMFAAICVLIWAMNEDILNFLMFGNIYLTCMFLFGNLVFILAMSYIQARQQSGTHKKLVLYNEKLLEADKLKDQIIATEMSFLQAQIKPHFLYNALSAIANVCEKDGKQAGKLIIDLAVYLRGSLEFHNLDKMVTIEKELEFIDTYFHIEQARFGQKIQLRKEIDVPLDVQIPVLILQPLVENAVRHGISKKTGGGTVAVRMSMAGADVVIEIEDDGAGIGEEKLAALIDGAAPAQSIGLRNINSRLLKLYGSGLEISSTPGHTLVKLSIPEVIRQ